MTTLPAMHRLWLNEVRSAFRPASIAGATVWDRAKAVTYLRERFVPRFRSERQAAANLVALLQPEKADPLQAAGDMVEAEVEQLARLATFHQKATEFRNAADDLIAALEAWCQSLEVAAEDVVEADLHLV
jgi:hypothetical protein